MWPAEIRGFCYQTPEENAAAQAESARRAAAGPPDPILYFETRTGPDGKEKVVGFISDETPYGEYQPIEDYRPGYERVTSPDSEAPPRSGFGFGFGFY